MKIVDLLWPIGRWVGAIETGAVMVYPASRGRLHATRTTLVALLESASNRMQRFILSTFPFPRLAKRALFLAKIKVHVGISITFGWLNPTIWQ